MFTGMSLFFLLGTVWCVVTYAADEKIVDLDNLCEDSDDYEMPVKGIYLIPHITLPAMSDVIVSRTISNYSTQPIKVQIIVNKIVSDFKLNHDSPFLLNDNSSHILEYKSGWTILKKQESINIVTASCVINAWKNAEYTQEFLLKLRARIVNKKDREYIKNKYKIFDITDPSTTISFGLFLSKNKIKIKSFL